jgi:hypothetical protein
MKTYFLAVILFVFGTQWIYAQSASSPGKTTKKEQQIMDISKAKWQWMAEKKMDKLEELFDL